MISANVAPLERFISATTWAFLLERLGMHMFAEVPRDGLIPARFEVTGIPEQLIAITR